MRYVKYHALGNDYVVIPTTDIDRRSVELICHRNYGVGADGILLGPLQMPGDRTNSVSLFCNAGKKCRGTLEGLTVPRPIKLSGG
jgi:diaminopimelate epimerase